MSFAPLGWGLFEASVEPETLSLCLGLLFNLLELPIIFGIGLHFDGDGHACSNHFLVEHLVAAIDVGEQPTVTILLFPIEFEPEILSITTIQDMRFGLGAVFLPPLGRIDTDEPDFLRSSLVLNEQGISINNGKKTDEFCGWCLARKEDKREQQSKSEWRNS